MTEPSNASWDGLADLAARIGLPAERVPALRRRLAADGPRHPLTLLAGRPDAGIEVLLARWLGPAAAEAVAGDQPTAFGPGAADVAKSIGGATGPQVSPIRTGCLVAVRSSGRPASSLLARLGSVGRFDRLVLVTRLGQPLHSAERELAASLAGISATARVLVLGLAGEEPSASDLAEVSAYAAAQLREAGFAAGRNDGAAVWFPGGSSVPGVLSEPTEFIAPSAASPLAVDGMRKQALSVLFSELRAHAEAAPPAPPAVPAEEVDRLSRELADYVADLSRQVRRKAEGPSPPNAEELRRHVVDSVAGWAGYTSLEGMWMRLVDAYRPGGHASLLAEVREAVKELEIAPAPASMEPTAPSDPMTAAVYRAGWALGVGIFAYLLVTQLLHRASPVPMPDLLVVAAGLAGGGLAGLATFRILLRPKAPPSPRQEVQIPPPVSASDGWPRLTGRLTAWCRRHLSNDERPLIERINELEAVFIPAEEARP